MELLIAGIKGFFYAILLIIVLVCSLVGIIVILISHAVVTEMIKVVISVFGGAVPTNIEQIAYMLLFVSAWILMAYGIHQGREEQILGGLTLGQREKPTSTPKPKRKRSPIVPIDAED